MKLSHSERHTRLFERIAIPYGWFFIDQTRSYEAVFDIGRSALPDPRGKTALDLGCGTGAFTAALKKEGWSVTGIDAAQGMVNQARQRGVHCSVADVLHGLPYEDHSFDLVSAAYVAHGLRRDDRLALFREARRLSRGLVLFHDYTPDRHLLISIIEYLEGGDYFGFIKTGLEDMQSVFSSVRQIRVGKQAAWYLCEAS
ncbi:class I SAM-dependent methyltransferase [Gracilinema caldarium]|uniref:class I SAM-dependent methyltransferase n=1 Tax=Gracilinema caldarium TaxID=215591 RepID=UPI0026EC432A|nr:methyltransferase domain-containing protein [Gracilinema caldarium]